MRVPRVRYPAVVRSIAIVAVLTIAAPQAASAQGSTGVPQGNSALSQYLEAIPTASGSQATNRIHSHRSHSAGSTRGGSNSGGGAGGTTGSGGGAGGSGSGSGGGGAGTTSNAPSSSAVPSSTNHALSSQGSTGADDAAFARATAPSKASAHAGAASTVNGPARANVPSSANVPSPASAVLKSLTGASSGGLGSLLPAILIVAALATGLLALVRRRTHRAGS